jgi:hypothetical protein
VASGAGAVAACGAAPSARADEEHPATRRSADPKPTVTLPRCWQIAMWDEPELVAQVILDGAAPAAG